MVRDNTLKWTVLPRIFVLRWVYILSLSGSFSVCSLSVFCLFIPNSSWDLCSTVRADVSAKGSGNQHLCELAGVGVWSWDPGNWGIYSGSQEITGLWLNCQMLSQLGTWNAGAGLEGSWPRPQSPSWAGGGEWQGTSRLALWLGKSGNSEGLTRPHSPFTPVKEHKSRSPSHFETSILTDSLLYNRGVVRELFSVCKREKCPSFQNKYSSILKCFYMYKNKLNFLNHRSEWDYCRNIGTL